MCGISVYIHIPFCRSKCSYCDFFSRPGIESRLDDYINSLCNEIEFYSKASEYKQINTLYIGGGTPSLLSIFHLEKLFSTIQKCFTFAEKDFEATIELNPDDVSDELISFLNNSFINRISLGIQSLKQKTLSLMKRRASRETSLAALSLIKQKFSKRFSADLIAGFPGETETDLFENIKELISFEPEHISLYSLCVEEGTCLYNQIESGELEFDQNVSDKIWLSAKNLLEENGYHQYEISNFSKTEKSQSIHNLTYWHLKNYFGFGSAATGSFFFKEKSIRYTNSSDINKYINFWNNKSDQGSFESLKSFTGESEKIKLYSYDDFKNFLSYVPAEVELIDKETEEFEFFMMNFRLRKGVSETEFESRFGKSLDHKLCAENSLFSRWMSEGKAEIAKDENGEVYYRLTEEGILYLNYFLENM